MQVIDWFHFIDIHFYVNEIKTTTFTTGQAFMELSKDKSNSKQAEVQTHQFIKTLALVESKLSEQINYLTQVSTGKY